jgi:hypothetical protein
VSAHGSNLSRNGASDNPGAIQTAVEGSGGGAAALSSEGSAAAPPPSSTSPRYSDTREFARSLMSKVFVSIALSLDGYLAPEGMTMSDPGHMNWGAKGGRWPVSSISSTSVRT